MRFDYITMTEALGGDATRAAAPFDADDRRPRRAPSTRSERDTDLVCLVDAASARALRRRTGARPTSTSTSAGGTSSASSARRARARRRCCGSSLGALAPSAGAVHAATGPARRLRAAGRDRQLELPGDGRRVRAHGARPPAAAAVGAAGASGPRSAAVLERLGIAELGAAPHPRAVGRPAAARVPRPGAAAASPTCCCSTSRRRASTSRTRHEVLHLLDDLNARRARDRAHDPRPQRHRRPPAAPRVPEPPGDRRRAPRAACSRREVLERTYGAPHARCSSTPACPSSSTPLDAAHATVAAAAGGAA